MTFALKHEMLALPGFSKRRAFFDGTIIMGVVNSVHIIFTMCCKNVCLYHKCNTIQTFTFLFLYVASIYLSILHSGAERGAYCPSVAYVA